MDHPAPPPQPHVWLAEAHEAPEVARLLVAFRNHLGFDSPSDGSFLASVQRLMDDDATEYLLGAVRRGAPPAGVVQLRYRWAVWRDGYDCLLEDLFVAPEARRGGLGRAAGLIGRPAPAQRSPARAWLSAWISRCAAVRRVSGSSHSPR
jgi:GNAT superfamily N-acetyltransferase